jgi:hypothetical protein
MKNTIGLLIIFTFCFSYSYSESLEVDFNNMPSLIDIIKQSTELNNLSEPVNPLPTGLMALKTPWRHDNGAINQAPTEAKKTKDWTIMIFLNGKNDLANFALGDLNEMEQIGSTEKINIVVEAGRINYTPPFPSPYPWNDYDDYPDVYPRHPWGPGVHPQYPLAPSYLIKSEPVKLPSFTGVKRFYVQKDTDTSNITSPVIEELAKADMGDWNHLAEFGLWAKNRFPAKRYMLIVWNHGDGWKSSQGLVVNPLKAISIDEETGHEISTIQLGQALQKMGGVDIYGSDACLMQMAEVVYELKNYAPVIIGSEETEPADGWAYHLLLGRLEKYSRISSQTIAKAVVRSYEEYYKQKGKGVTLSAVNISYFENLRQLLDQWTDIAMKTNQKEKLKEAMNESMSFSSGSRDLIHFLTLASSKVNLQELFGKSQEIINLIVSNILIDNINVGDSYKNAYGLAIYIPSYSYDSKYNDLAWAKNGKWDEFIQWLIQQQ